MNCDLPKIYNERLEELVIKNNMIPRRIKPGEHLRIYHRYWIDGFSPYVKIDDINICSGHEYYFIKYDKMNGVISHPICDEAYELLHNVDNIENDDIINSDKAYTGAEIRFWFIVNRDKISKKDYMGFYPRLSNIIDNKYYKVKSKPVYDIESNK